MTTRLPRFRFIFDTGTQFEECNGKSEPLTEAEYAENSYNVCPLHPVCWCACDRELVPMPYAQYLEYYGNPDRHVYIAIACINYNGTERDALYGIDLMDDSPEYLAFIRLRRGQSVRAATALRLPGYLAELAAEMLSPVERLIARHEAGTATSEVLIGVGLLACAFALIILLFALLAHA